MQWHLVCQNRTVTVTVQVYTRSRKCKAPLVRVEATSISHGNPSFPWRLKAASVELAKQELVVKEKKLSLSSKDRDFPESPVIDSVLALQDIFDLRARAFHMLDVCPFKVSIAFGDRIISKLRATTPDGMRSPTLNEARRCDGRFSQRFAHGWPKERGQ